MKCLNEMSKCGLIEMFSFFDFLVAYFPWSDIHDKHEMRDVETK